MLTTKEQILQEFDYAFSSIEEKLPRTYANMYDFLSQTIDRLMLTEDVLNSELKKFNLYSIKVGIGNHIPSIEHLGDYSHVAKAICDLQRGKK